MITDVQLSGRSLELLQRRSLSATDVSDFQALLNEARQAQAGGTSARDLLSAMNAQERDLVRRANGLVDSIDSARISDEGAYNLLAQPDASDRVDLNNDGIVDVGAAKTIVFPPVNAPPSVQDAWARATAGMDEGDLLTAQLHFHTAVYGVKVDGVPTKVPLPADQQWSSGGIDSLFAQLRASLDFSVQRDGWTDTNRMFRDLYDRFERELV